MWNDPTGCTFGTLLLLLRDCGLYAPTKKGCQLDVHPVCAYTGILGPSSVPRTTPLVLVVKAVSCCMHWTCGQLSYISLHTQPVGPMPASHELALSSFLDRGIVSLSRNVLVRCPVHRQSCIHRWPPPPLVQGVGRIFRESTLSNISAPKCVHNPPKTNWPTFGRSIGCHHLGQG